MVFFLQQANHRHFYWIKLLEKIKLIIYAGLNWVSKDAVYLL